MTALFILQPVVIGLSEVTHAPTIPGSPQMWRAEVGAKKRKRARDPTEHREKYTKQILRAAHHHSAHGRPDQKVFLIALNNTAGEVNAP